MLSWLELLINRYCCILLVVYIIVSMMHGHTNIKWKIFTIFVAHDFTNISSSWCWLACRVLSDVYGNCEFIKLSSLKSLKGIIADYANSFNYLFNGPKSTVQLMQRRMRKYRISVTEIHLHLAPMLGTLSVTHCIVYVRLHGVGRDIAGFL